MKNIVGMRGIKREFLDPIYRSEKPGNDLVYVSVGKDLKRKSLNIDIAPFKTKWDEIWGSMRKINKKKVTKKIEEDDDKPVDTSNWVKADTETLENHMLMELGMLLVLKEETREWYKAHYRMNMLYSILHNKSPSNPQILMNYFTERYLDIIFGTLGNKKQGSYVWKLINKMGKKGYNEKTLRKDGKDWENRMIDSMITVREK